MAQLLTARQAFGQPGIRSANVPLIEDSLQVIDVNDRISQ